MITTPPLLPGHVYHVYNRGNNRETIFREASNYAFFLHLWKRHIHPVADTFAYAMLGNHFHAMVRIHTDVEAARRSEVARMNQAEQKFANFFNAYAKAFNKSYGRTGKLFEARFKKKLVDSPYYFTQLIYYIHSNAQRHGFTADFQGYPHSSYRIFLSASPTSLERQEVLKWFGGQHGFMEYHDQLYRTLKDFEVFGIEED